MIHRLLRISSPAHLPLQRNERVLLYHEGKASEWERVDTAGAVFLHALRDHDLTPGKLYEIVRQGDETLVIRLRVGKKKLTRKGAMSIQLIIGPDAITSYRRLAYSPWHAIAEFVDNSTQSYFDNRDALDECMKNEDDKILTVSVAYDKAKMLRVVDNAMGMSSDDLERALHVARPPVNTTGRSKYAMGMKTAACWMGDQWTIRTKKLGESVEHSVTVDVNKVAGEQTDSVVYTSTPKPAERHYTIVEIVTIHRIFQGRTLGKIADFLRSMYRSDLRTGILSLRWRDQSLTWESVEDRLLVASDGTKYRKDFTFDVDGKTVQGWVGILAKGTRADAGFSVLQANRVVRGWPDAWRPSTLYGQFQGSNDLVNQRLVGEIHLDDFDVSHTKDNILWRGSQEDDVEDGLKAHCSDYRDFAKDRRKDDDDQRGPSEVDIKAALDDLEKELTSPEMVDQINISVIPSPEIIDASKEKSSLPSLTRGPQRFRA